MSAPARRGRKIKPTADDTPSRESVADALRINAEIANADHEESQRHRITDEGIGAEIREAEREAEEYLRAVPLAPRLSPARHPQRDFFVADIFDWSPKDDTSSMEHPLFALKAGDRKPRQYKRNGITVTIKPGTDGRATIHDKDLWIYCISQLVEAINRGREDVSRTVQFTAYDFLVTTNRDVGGRAYKLMGDMLSRLKGTVIETNIETAELRERRGFGLIDSWRVIEKDRKTQRMVAVEVTLPDWLFRSVQARQVLTLSRDYFRLRKPLDRRIYELARKHCGHQSRWCVSLAALHEKSGTTDSKLRKFRAAMKALVAANDLPDYRLMFDAEADTVTFYARASKGAKALIVDQLARGEHPKRRHRP